YSVPPDGIPAFSEKAVGGFNWGGGITLADVNLDGGMDVLVAGITSNSLPVFVTHCPALAVGDGPLALAFAPIQPNPSRGGARLVLSLPQPAHVRLEVFDACGRGVRELANGKF